MLCAAVVAAIEPGARVPKEGESLRLHSSPRLGQVSAGDDGTLRIWDAQCEFNQELVEDDRFLEGTEVKATKPRSEGCTHDTYRDDKQTRWGRRPGARACASGVCARKLFSHTVNVRHRFPRRAVLLASTSRGLVRKEAYELAQAGRDLRRRLPMLALVRLCAHTRDAR